MNVIAAEWNVDGLEQVQARARQRLDEGVTHLNEAACRELFGTAVPFGPAESVPASEPAAARDAADRLGYPVVCKLLSPDVLHKTELGLVRVGLSGPDEVYQAAEELTKLGIQAGLSDPKLSVQRQLEGFELAIGIVRDDLGVVCLVAAGGTLIELIEDSAQALAPVSVAEARQLIGQLKVAKVLEGYRGQEGMDIDAAAGLLSMVSQLAIEIPEISELDLNPVFVSPEGVSVADARITLAPAPPADGRAAYDDLEAFVAPKRIAMIGGSSARLKVGGLVIRYLRKHGYTGDLIAVNPNGNPIEGAEVVRSLSDIKKPVDLACIALPQDGVLNAVTECIDAGITHGIIYSAGFAEAGPDGMARQRELLDLADGKFRFVGPNSMGVAAPDRKFFASFGMALEVDKVQEGGVAFISQSGSIASSLFSRAEELGVGFSHWISVGNEADLGVEDFLAYLATQDSCKMICLFLEVIRHPAAFAEAARRVRAARKPIIAFKTGRSEIGRLATASHTGALASPHANYASFLARHGVHMVSSLEDLFSAAAGMQMIGPVNGNRVGIVSMSGGACSMLSDSCAAAGLLVPELSPSLQAQLREVLPSYASTRNPVDVTASAIQKPEYVRKALEVLLGSGAVDIVLLQLGTNADPSASRMALDLLELRSQFAVPVLVSRLGSPSLAPEAMSIYREAGVHVFQWPNQLVNAAVACVAAGNTFDS